MVEQLYIVMGDAHCVMKELMKRADHEHTSTVAIVLTNRKFATGYAKCGHFFVVVMEPAQSASNSRQR